MVQGDFYTIVKTESSDDEVEPAENRRSNRYIK